MTSSFSHISANISGTRKDTEMLQPPNERSCLQLSNGVRYVPVTIIVLKIFPLKCCRDALQNREISFLGGIALKLYELQ